VEQRLQAALDADHLTSFFSELQPAEQHGAWRMAVDGWAKEEKNTRRYMMWPLYCSISYTCFWSHYCSIRHAFATFALAL
jgi:hypothetical protein